MTEETYTCEFCRGTFLKGWSHEEAVAEAERDFPGVPVADMAEICDDCYWDLSEKYANMMVEDANAGD